MPRNANAVPIPHDINSGIEVVDSLVNNSLPAPTIGASMNPLQIYVEIGAYIWALGIIVLLVYSLVSILILKRQLKSAELIEKNIYEAKNLKTPFVLGLIKPKIYLPVGLNATERSYILLHEQTHVHRKDHIIKVLAFLILSIHWFNPLVWVAFILMSTDMELSCDERVLRQMNNEDIKKPYVNSLLSLATGKHILNGSSLAFDEGNVRGRIKNVLNYKRPRFWVIVLSIVIVTVAGIGLMANPKAATIEPTAPELSLEQIVGVDMVQLDYASNDIVIFHDYFGLFVYDINSHQIVRGLDLKPLNCHQTQGDNYCDVLVSMDGNTVQLHPMSSENMFVYTISDNTLKETTHMRMEKPFGSQFVSIEEVINSTKLGNHSHHAILFDTGEHGYLHAEDGTIGTLSYVRGDKVFRLFDIKASLSDRRPMIKVGDTLFLDTNKEISIEIGDSDIIGEVVSSVTQHKKPVKNGQTNFGSIGSKYAYYDDGLVVLLKNKWIFFEKENNIYPLEFFQLSNAKIENLQLDNINKIIEEKIIDKELSAFIFTDNENSELKGGINLNGKFYYIGQVSMENTPEDLMGIEEIQVFGKKAVKIYGILGANYAQAFYWFVEEKPEESIIQIDGNTVEIDLDSDDKNEIVATTGTIPETRIYMLKEGKIVVSDINKLIGAKSVTLQDKDKKLFEVYFEPNKPEQYMYYRDSFIKK
jgi:beta-lactamase regulating signal transducer with metallopeptidase domain